MNIEKDKFLSIISHDLQSPFNVFFGLTELLSSNFTQISSEETQDLLVRMNDSAKSLYNLLENLLQWASLQEGRLPFDPKEINVSQLTQEIIDIEKESIRRKELQIVCQIDENLQVVADHYMLQSVVRNLLSNAIKFTSRKGKVIILNEDLKISISDSGIGMNKKMLDNLFKLGEDTSRNGTDGELSTGLGLFLCQGFVERHKGKLWAESEEGKGSVFHFTLPNK